MALVLREGREKEHVLASIIASCFVPVPAVSEANRKGHEPWRKSQKRHLAQKEHTLLTLRSWATDNQTAIRELVLASPSIVRLTSVSVQQPDDDNLASSVKYYRDAVAFWLGIDDKDPRVRFVPKWERWRGKGQRGVRIEFVEFKEHLLEARAEIDAQLATLTGEK